VALERAAERSSAAAGSAHRALARARPLGVSSWRLCDCRPGCEHPRP
jgi:hypothetical protein